MGYSDSPNQQNFNFSLWIWLFRVLDYWR
jgi:hypothetical protein